MPFKILLFTILWFLVGQQSKDSELSYINFSTEYLLNKYAIADSGFRIEKIIPYDLNNDGFQDIVFWTYRVQPRLSKIKFIPGDKKGIVFGNITTIIEDSLIFSLIIEDWNGDLQPDLITHSIKPLNESESTYALKIWLLNNLTIQESIDFGLPLEYYQGNAINPLFVVEVLDFDMDGKIDLVLAGSKVMRIGWNDGAEKVNFEQFTNSGQNTYYVNVFDYNQDGYNDFTIDIWDGEKSEPILFQNEGKRVFTQKSINLPAVSSDSQTGFYHDFKAIWVNQDSYPDLFIHRDNGLMPGQFYEIYEYQTASGEYKISSLQIPNTDGKITPIHFNEDGYIDFFEVSNDRFTIWINNENKTFKIKELNFNGYRRLENLFNLDSGTFFSFFLGDTLYQIVNNNLKNNKAPSPPEIDTVIIRSTDITIEWSKSVDDNSLNGHINYSLRLKSGKFVLDCNTHLNRITLNDLVAGDYSLNMYAIDPHGKRSELSNTFFFSIITSSLIDTKNNIKGFKLNQNYPNPFNPITQMIYEIPKTTHVKLNVYDIQGHQVRTLVNNTRYAGTHRVIFDGSGLASGIYFYRLKTDDFSSVKCMLLMK